MADAISRNYVSFLLSGSSCPNPSHPHPSGAGGPADRATAGLDVPDLGPVVRELFSAGLALSTRRNYKTGSKRYLEFCHSQRTKSPFPVSEQTLCRFVAWLHMQHLSSSTANNYLAAVRHSQVALGLGDPKMASMAQLEYVIRGMKRTAQTSKRTRLPISPAILLGMKRTWQRHPNPRDAAMLWAAATMCFFGFLRVGEMVIPSNKYDPGHHLAHGDVTVNDSRDPQFVVVRIKASKTDPFRQGTSIYLGRTHSELCPVVAILGYMVQRGTGEGPFFTFEDGRWLTRERFVSEVRKALTELGYNCSLYAGHSFRIGAATTAAQRGVQDSLIKTLGRWESTAYMVYIRTPPEVLCSVASTLVGTGLVAGSGRA